MAQARGNEVGTAPARGRPRIPNDETEERLSQVVGEPVKLPESAVVYEGPETCPACGSRRVMWGDSKEQTRDRKDIHPLVWHEKARMADSFICRDCWAGWIEPDEPEEIVWVRPYWLVK